MKYFLTIPILAVLILTGCSKENSIVGPQQQTQTTNQWIQINHSSTLSVENTYSASKTINGNNGGTIDLPLKMFINNGHLAFVAASLKIPSHAFTGTKAISFTVNTDCAGVDFSPAMTFSKNLSLDITFTGVDISGYDPSHLGFAYLDGTGIIPAQFVLLNANILNGLLLVQGAQITHFSRYGWATIDGPLPQPINDGGSE